MRSLFRIAAVGLVLSCAGCGESAEVRGNVTEVDPAKGTVTLSHEAIPNIQMPAMTMVFAVTDPAMINGLKEGDKVRFTADFVNGTVAVTSIRRE